VRHTLSILVRNDAGVLSRVAGMFSGRGYNIESLNVAPTLDPEVSNVTLVTGGDDKIIEQITKQLHKIISVIAVTDELENPKGFVNREMAMLKVFPKMEQRAEVLRVSEIFRGKIVHVDSKSFVVEVSGSQDKIHAMAELLRPLGLKELVRTGPLAMRRGN
jgi:acetolactate synthase-1/3 small subunit